MVGKPKHLKSIDLRDHALRWKFDRELPIPCHGVVIGSHRLLTTPFPENRITKKRHSRNIARQHTYGTSERLLWGDFLIDRF